MKSLVGFAWVLMLSACCAAASAEEPHEAWMKYLSGTWEWEMPDGQKGTMVWEMDKSAPVLVGHGKIGPATWFSAMSWHAGEKVVLDRVYNNGAGQSETRYDVIEANEMTGVEKGWGPDGESSSKISLTRNDDQTWTYHRTDHMIGGEQQPDLKVSIKRVKNPKALAAPAAEKADDGN